VLNIRFGGERVKTELTKRQEGVLYAVVHEFITLKRPVSSKKILEITSLNCSSATIRNEMKKLEEMGYIIQPHISAGRLPTDKGYRFYVECLKNMKDITVNISNEIELVEEFKYNNIDELLAGFAVFLARWMGGLAIIERPFIEDLRISRVSLTNIFLNYWVVVVVTNMGISETFIVPMEEKFPIREFERFLSEKLHGLSLKELKQLLNQMDLPDYSWYNPDYDHVFTFLKQMVNKSYKNRFQKYGLELLVRDETLSQNDLKNCLVYTENDDRILELFSILDSEDFKSVNIGSETRREELNGFSIFLQNYLAGEQKLGRMIVITSKATDYLQNLKGMRFVSSRITEYLSRLINLNE
jgi:heat-inducible transcriptional repressor